MTSVIDSKECGNIYIEITQDKDSSGYKVTASEYGKTFDTKSYGTLQKAKAVFKSLCKQYCNEGLERSSMTRKLRIRESFEDEYRDRDGYLTEEHADYLETSVYIPISVFDRDTNYIYNYITEEAARSRDYRSISLNDYKIAERYGTVLEMDEDEEIYPDIENITLFVKFVVDQNGEYDFDEYLIKQNIDHIRAYIMRETGRR